MFAPAIKAISMEEKKSGNGRCGGHGVVWVDGVEACAGGGVLEALDDGNKVRRLCTRQTHAYRLQFSQSSY